MRRFALAVFLFALSARAVSPTMDPAPGVVIGQKAFVKNQTTGDITISGTTLIRLASPITLGADKTLDLIWDGTNWVLFGTVGRFSNSASFSWAWSVLNSDPLGTPCRETNRVTVSGALYGDFCRISSPALGADGGTGLTSTARLSCRAVDGAAIGQLCSVLTDGGSYTLGDAGYTIEVSR